MRRLIQNKGFWLLLTGQGVSTLGDVLYSVATLALAYTVTRSVLGTAGLLLATTLVRLLAGFVTVQVLDRVPHRTLMFLGDTVRFVAVGTLGVYGLGHPLGMPVVYAVAVVNALAGAFFTPARAAMLPLLVDRADLVRANGLMASTTQVVQTAAWAVGAALAAVVGTPGMILLNAASFLVSAATSALIRPMAAPAEAARQVTPLERLKAGWREVWTNRVVRDVTIMDGLETFANTIWTSAFMLAFTVQVLGADEAWWGYQGSAYFLGTILGGLVAVVTAGWLSRRGGWAVAFSSGSFAVLTVWYALTRSAPLAVALCVAFGPVYQVRDVVQSAMLQASLDPRVIGRAYATREMVLNALFGPALVAMSLLADAAGPQAAYLTGAALYAVVAVFAAASAPIRTYQVGVATHSGG